MNMSNDEYGRLADRRTPDSPILKNCICAFVIGGLICTLPPNDLSIIYIIQIRLVCVKTTKTKKFNIFSKTT